MGYGSLSTAPQHPGTAVKGTRSSHFRSEATALRPPLSGYRHSSDRRSRLRARQLKPAPPTSGCPHYAVWAATLDAGPQRSVIPLPPHPGTTAIRCTPPFWGRGRSHPRHRLHPGTAANGSGRPCCGRGYSAKLRPLIRVLSVSLAGGHVEAWPHRSALPHPGTATAAPSGRVGGAAVEAAHPAPESANGTKGATRGSGSAAPHQETAIGTHRDRRGGCGGEGKEGAVRKRRSPAEAQPALRRS